MAGTNEQMVQLLEGILERLGDVVDALDALGKQGTGASAEGSSGSAANASGALRRRRGGRGGGGKAALVGQALELLGGPAAAGAASAARAGAPGLRQLQLGNSAGAAGGAIARGLAESASSGIFGSAFFANTRSELDAQGRAQSSVSGIAEQVARAGGQLSRDGLRQALRTQNDIERNVQNARNTVEGIALEEGQEGLAKAAGQDLHLDVLKDIAESLRTLVGMGGGQR